MLMNNLGQATEAMARVATQTANQQAQLTAALQRLVEDPRQGTRAPVATPGPASVPFDTGGKILKPPEAFSPATIEEEVSQWSDWAFTFKNFLAFMDQAFLTDLKSAEDQKVETSSDISNTLFGDDRERMNRGMKLYSVSSSYLRNRPLKVLRSVSGMNGFEVWMEKADSGTGTKFKVEKLSYGPGIGRVSGNEQRSIVDGLRANVRKAHLRV